MCRFYTMKELDSRLRGNDSLVILGLDLGIHLHSDEEYDDDDEEYEKEWCD